jgi:hypothetical protein
MDPELQKLYSPGMWNKRFTAEKLLEVHVQLTVESDGARVF